MEPTIEVNEGSTAYLAVELLDGAGGQALPSALRYRVDCGTTGLAVRDWTVLAPAATFELAMTAADNALQRQSNGSEARVVTFEATYGETDMLVSQHVYTVRGLPFVG